MYSIFCYILLILMANLGYIYTIYIPVKWILWVMNLGIIALMGTTNGSANRLMVTLMVWAQTQFPATPMKGIMNLAST